MGGQSHDSSNGTPDLVGPGATESGLRSRRRIRGRKWSTGLLAPLLLVGAGTMAGVLVTVLVTGGGDAKAIRVAPTPAPPSVTAATPVVVAPPVAKIPAVAKPGAGRGLIHVRPLSVSIPAIGVSSSLVGLGLQADGTVQVPTNFAQAGWYSGGPYPGDADGPPALLLGHVDSYTGPAVFYRLPNLHAGDRVNVKRADGSTAVFVVYRTAQYLKSAFPATTVYAPTARSEIRLITCSGQFDDQQRSYLSNFVVFAYLDVRRSR